MMTGLIELMMTMRMMMPVLIDAKRWGDHDDRGNHLGLFVPGSVSVHGFFLEQCYFLFTVFIRSILVSLQSSYCVCPFGVFYFFFLTIPFAFFDFLLCIHSFLTFNLWSSF